MFPIPLILKVRRTKLQESSAPLLRKIRLILLLRRVCRKYLPHSEQRTKGWGLVNVLSEWGFSD